MYSNACVVHSMLWNVCVIWCVYASCLLVQCQTCPSVASFSVQQASPKPQLWRTFHLAAYLPPSIFPLCSRLLLFIYSPSFAPLDPFLVTHVLPWVLIFLFLRFLHNGCDYTSEETFASCLLWHLLQPLKLHIHPFLYRISSRIRVVLFFLYC